MGRGWIIFPAGRKTGAAVGIREKITAEQGLKTGAALAFST